MGTESCTELNCVPRKFYVHLEPQDVTLHGNRVSGEVTSQESQDGFRMGPKPSAWCPQKAAHGTGEGVRAGWAIRAPQEGVDRAPRGPHGTLLCCHTSEDWAGWAPSLWAVCSPLSGLPEIRTHFFTSPPACRMGLSDSRHSVNNAELAVDRRARTLRSRIRPQPYPCSHVSVWFFSGDRGCLSLNLHKDGAPQLHSETSGSP